MELLIVLLIAFLPFIVIFSAIAVIAKSLHKRSRVPFEYSDMIRIPAFTLIQNQRDETFNMLQWTFMSAIYFQLPFSIPTLARLLGFESKIGQWWLYAGIFSIVAVYALVKAVQAFTKLRNIRLGIEAEWAVSYALSKITNPNVRVFHDIQGPNFNIDHVVTYPGGVLAIETKGRRKPNIKNSRQTHKVVVQGNKIQFPHGPDTAIIQQATRQATWLSKELSKSTGMEVTTSPLVVIPGWFIENKQKPTVPVMNHKSLTKYYSLTKKTILNNSALERINHQIEQLAMRRSDEL